MRAESADPPPGVRTSGAMDLDELKLIVRAGELGGISAAARELGMLPATASAALLRAEREIGGKLFVRTTRSLRPTPNGELFLERARQAIALLDDARERFRSDRQRVQGLLRLSSPVDIGEQVVLPALDAFLDAHPGVQLALQLSDRLRDVGREQVDAVIRYGPIADRNLIARRLAEGTRVLVAAPAYLARRGTPRTPEALGEHECILRAARTPDTWKLLEGGARIEVEVAGRRLSDSGATTRRWALLGHGIALKAWFDVCEDLAAGRLVRVLPGVSSERYPLALAISPGVRHAARMRALGAWLAERFAQHARRYPCPD